MSEQISPVELNRRSLSVLVGGAARYCFARCTQWVGCSAAACCWDINLTRQTAEAAVGAAHDTFILHAPSIPATVDSAAARENASQFASTTSKELCATYTVHK